MLTNSSPSLLLQSSILSASVKSLPWFSFCRSYYSFCSFADYSSSAHFLNVHGPQSSNSILGCSSLHTLPELSTSFCPYYYLQRKQNYYPSSLQNLLLQCVPSINDWHTNIQQPMADTWGSPDPSLTLTAHISLKSVRFIGLKSVRFSPSLSIP